ncbi:ribonuclease H-like domain-containing protein [Tanacetum coccineum]
MTSPIPPPFSMPSPSQTFSFPSTSEPVFSVSTSEPAFESPNSQTSPNTQSQQQFQQYHTTTVSNNNAKFPYLKKDEYETWAMKMEYWIMNSDHNLWNIVINGNSRKKTGRDPKGNIMILPPVSVEENIAVQRETKARTILLQSLPEDHMADFHHLDDARDIWLAVKARFGGNDESKKMRKSMLKQEFLEFRVSESELRTLEIDVKGGSSYDSRGTSAPTHSAFISAASTNSKMSYADSQNQSPSITFTTASSSADTSSNVIESVLHSFVAERKQLDSKARYSAFKLKELDKSEEPKALLSVDSMLNWSDHEGEDEEKGCTKLALMVYIFSVQYKDCYIQVQAYKNTLQTLEQQKAWYQSNQLALEERIRILTADLENTTNMLKYTEKLNDQVKLEKLNDQVKLEESKARFDKWKESSKNLDKLINSSMSSRSKFGLGFGETFGSDEVFDPSAPSIFDTTPEDVEGKPLYDRFVKAVGMHVVPSPITGTFMPPSSHKLTLMIHSDKSSDSETTGFASCVSSVKSSSSKTNEHLASASSLVDFKTVSKTADQKPSSTIDDLSRNPPASVSAGSAFPTGSRNRPAIFSALCQFSAGWRNHAARPMTRPTSHYFQHFYKPWAYKPTVHGDGRWEQLDNPHKNKDLGIVDSGCSRSMTGNKEKLDDFVKIIGGTVTFGGGDGKITGKGTIRTSKLNFENVYYVEELQNFNLFSVSQICDKKNKVLFTDTECLVLTKEFQLPENSQVVLRVPRRHNLYSFNLTEIQPERDITCLLAKASSDESTKWHRRMAHVNFKNINKLAKHGLVNGLPSKLFTNDHNLDPFGPTSINGIESQVSNTLVYTDDLSRDYSNAKTPQQNGVAERKNRTLIEAARTMLADSKLPTMFWTEAVSTACYVLNRVLVTRPHNKTPYELLSGKVPNISHLKPFGCHVTILNTSDHLGKFEGKADEGFIVGYAAHSKAYRVYNLSSKKIEETLNLRYLEDKPNIQGLGQEWYFDLDYLTDSLGYTRFKSNQPAGTQDPHIHAGTQDDSDSECDEQVIVVPSFPSNRFSGPKVHEASEMVESNSDYAEELARLQRQEHEAKDTAEKYGFGFSKDTEEHLRQADMVPAGSIDPAASISAGSIDPAASISAGSIDPAASISAGSAKPFPTVIEPVHADGTSLPPGHSLGSSEHSTRFTSPSDLANSISSSLEMEDIYHHTSTGIFSSSSYDADFGGTVTNLAPIIAVDSVPTKRTRGTLKKSKFGKSTFVSYVHDQQRNNHTDYLHCLFACFLSQLEPSSVAQALNDPDWVEAMQEEMQQFINQKVWQLIPLPDGKIAIGTKWILKNKRDARGIVVRKKARLVAQGHRQEEGIDYDDVFALVARIEAIRLFLAFASYMGFMVYQMDVKSAFLYGEIDEEVYVTQPKAFEDPHFPKHVYKVVKALYGLHQAPRAWYTRLSTFLLKHNYRRASKPKSKDEPDDAVNVYLYRSMIGSLMYLIGRNLKDTLRRKGCDDSFIRWSMLRRNPSGLLRRKVPWALHFGAFLVQISCLLLKCLLGP